MIPINPPSPLTTATPRMVAVDSTSLHLTDTNVNQQNNHACKNILMSYYHKEPAGFLPNSPAHLQTNMCQPFFRHTDNHSNVALIKNSITAQIHCILPT